jgi:hypothetical protein
MNFANIVKKNADVVIEQPKEVVIVEKEIDEFIEPIHEKWSSHFSWKIIELFSDIKYDFNILLDRCDITNFFDFVIANSSIYEPYPDKDDSESEEEIEDDYISD